MTLELVLFSLDVLSFTANLCLVGLLWFSDKHTKQVKALIAMGVATCYWTILDAIAMVARPEAYGYMYTLRSVMLIVAPVAFLWFVLCMNELPVLEKPWFWLLLTALPIADVVLLLTNPLHHLVFAEYGFPLPEYGPLFTLHSLIAYGAIAIGLVFLARFIHRSKPPQWFTIICAIASSFAIVVNVLFTLKVISLPQDVAPFAFFVMFAVFTVYAYRARLANFKTTALTDIFESYTDAVLIVDEHGQISDCNGATGEFFPGLALDTGSNTIDEFAGYLQKMAVGVSPANLFVNLQSGTEERMAGEFMVQAPGGEIKTFTLARRPVIIGWGKRTAGYILAFSDISRYRNMIAEIEQQNRRLTELKDLAESASAAKTSFLANMSHEMRTPLNAILGLGELELRKTGLPAETRETLVTISNSGNVLLNVINDILDISKIESGRFELVRCNYDLPSMINDTVSLNMVRIGAKPIAFELEVDATLPMTLYGDELRIKQILNNLLSNAIKYTHAGTVGFAVSHKADGQDVWLEFEVQDTGIGIREKDIDRLFADYAQMDSKLNRHVEGTGLGLSICRHLTQMMGGTIGVVSEYGKGSTFTVSIRQEVVNSTPIGEKTAHNLASFHYAENRRNEKAAPQIVPMPYGRVLVVDDLEINLEVAKAIMQPYGLQIDCALSGREAIELVKAGKPRYDLIFMDHMMPDLDGVETVGIIRREINSEYARMVPIVALTANALTGNEELFFRAGFQDFLSKPIDFDEIDRILHKWVKRDK